MPGTELFDQREIDAVSDVLRRRMVHRYSSHAARKGVYRVSEFEEALAARVKSRHCLAVSNGTSALFVALKGLNIQPGDEVITSAFTFIATVEAIVGCGAIPVLADVDETLGIDAASVEAKITPRTKAIMPVHMFGQAVNMEALMDVARRHNLPVVEDACESVGGTLHGKALGIIGTVGTYSFDPNKYLSTGEGGAIVTDDEDLFHRMEYYHDHGHVHSLEVERGAELKSGLGLNFRMSELEGALGLVALEKMDDALASLRHTKKNILDGVAHLAGKGLIARPCLDAEGDIATHVSFLLPTAEITKGFKAAAAKEGLGLNLLSDNTWHYAAHWEALEKMSGMEIGGNTAPSYAPQTMDITEQRLNRTLFICPDIKTSDEKISSIVSALSAAAEKAL